MHDGWVEETPPRGLACSGFPSVRGERFRPQWRFKVLGFGLGFGVWGLGFGVWGLGFRV